MYKISTESLSLFLKTMKVGLLQIFFKKPFAKKRNKTTNNMNKQGGKCVLLFLSFFFFLVKRKFFFLFPQEEVEQTEQDQHWTQRARRWNWTRVTCFLSFYLQRHDCMRYICSDRPLFFLKSEDHLRRKHLHWTDNKRQFSSTKGSLVAIITVWQVSHTVKHQ